MGQLRDSFSILDDLRKLKPGRPRPITQEVLPATLAHHRLSDREVDELVQAYRDGATLKDLVRRFDVCQSTVLTHLDRHGVVRRQPVGLSPSDVKEATRLYESGMSLKQVGEKVGFHSRTVRKYLSEAGVPIRSRSGGD